jgi:hypothetical protein
MKNLKNPVLAFITLFIIAHHAHASTVTKIIPRSQSLNSARQMVGWNNPDWGINRKTGDEFYASTNLTFEYTRTFHNNRIARSLFGSDLVCNDCGESLIISGSQRNDRTPVDWLADYFGLPRDFKSVVSFSPHITNYLLEFSFYVGLDQWYEGLYFRLHAPFVHTGWKLGAQEKILSPGSVGYFQGYFGPDSIGYTNEASSATVDLLNTAFLNYTNGCTPALPDNVCWQALECSTIFSECVQSQATLNGMADVRFVFGWNFLNNEEGNYHLGLGIYTAAPTGTRPGYGCSNAPYLFEPIIGNGKFWELGGQITAHHIWWRSDTDESRFGFYAEIDIMHLFNTNQIRCFDLLCNGPSSRYMIAQRLTPNANYDPRLDGASDAGLQFANEFAPVANLTQRVVNVSIGAQADMSFTFQYQKNNFSWDVGYNFWGRSCEKICFAQNCTKPAGTWALKGDNRVYGFVNSQEYPNEFNGIGLPVAIAATDSTATIHQGSNLRNGVDYTPVTPQAPNNLYADSAIAATATANNGAVTNGIVTLYIDQTETGYYANQLYTSSDPILIQECNFNLTGSRGISNKFFTHLNWGWNDRDETNWTPYFGFGAEVEFGNISKNCFPNANIPTGFLSGCDNGCCTSCAITQWGLWLKAGTSYN